VFGGLRAVDDVSLTVRAGERRAVIGPNGAGKTTLFNVISGEVTVTAGRILMFGDDVTRRPQHQRAARGLARTFQITRLFPSLSVLDNVGLACTALDTRKFSMLRSLSSFGDVMEKAEELLAEFGLADQRHDLARNLSYGDQRKLEVALSMVGRPRLLLLDEPMAGLSAHERESMQEILQRLDPAIAVMLIEHDMDIAFGFAQHVTVMHQGRLLAEGTKDQISATRSVQEIYLGTA
jgi:branched-chain amino acid transport system ATP-binding protein